MITSKPRITYVDTLKGICIILVIYAHSGLPVNNHDNELIMHIENALRTYRMPTYYFLSGIFFKMYTGFNEFARRKVNNIIIPLFFFYILNVIISAITSYGISAVTGAPSDFNWSYVFDIFHQSTVRIEAVVPLWFLISLFWANLFFFIMKRWLKDYAVIAVVALLAVLGYYLESHHIDLPLFLISTFFGLPYYVLGHYVKRFGWLERETSRWLGIVQFFIVAALVLVYARNYREIDAFNLGTFMIFRFLVPFVSILSLFWLCKSVPYRIPIVTTLFGRYSIIALGTHMFFLSYLYLIPRAILGAENEVWWRICTFAIVMALELVIIPFMRDTFPRFTAQKDFFKPGWKI